MRIGTYYGKRLAKLTKEEKKELKKALEVMYIRSNLFTGVLTAKVEESMIFKKVIADIEQSLKENA